ncbi:MAG TPA: winged helix DNA-binding domain-containing protein [Actinomycetota bacterium]
MTEELLSRQALNRSLLARQHLLQRRALPLPLAMEQVGGLQTQYAPAGYVGLWSRLEGLTRDALTRALFDRSVVQGTLMRSTIHMVSATDYWRFARGITKGRRAWFLRTHARTAGGIDMHAVARVIRGLLADGPSRRSELVGALDEAGFPAVAWSGAGLWVDMVRVPPSGTWERRRADLYGLAEAWVSPDDAAGAADAPSGENGAASVHLVRRYLGGFGPATLNDIAGWAGLKAGDLRLAAPALGLRRYRDEEGRELLDLPDAPLPDPATPAPVRFLPVWDATLLVHARRTQILPEEFRSRVFHTKNPQSVNTFLVDGSVAGSWRYERGQIVLDPFRTIPRTLRRELDAEAERLAAFHA